MITEERNKIINDPADIAIKLKKQHLRYCVGISRGATRTF